MFGVFRCQASVVDVSPELFFDIWEMTLVTRDTGPPTHLMESLSGRSWYSPVEFRNTPAQISPTYSYSLTAHFFFLRCLNLQSIIRRRSPRFLHCYTQQFNQGEKPQEGRLRSTKYQILVYYVSNTTYKKTFDTQ